MASILVIEDELAIQEDIADLLEMENHQVHLSSNGQEGLEKAKILLPDLIISDIMMPKMDGFEMIRWLKKNPATASIPVLFLTARVERSNVRQGMQLGAEDYLTKPFTTSELLDTIDTLLRKQADLEERYVAPLRTIQNAITHSLPHEFRTPLYGIIASGELLSQFSIGLTDEQVKEIGQTIMSSGQRLHRVIEHYLLFAQLELVESTPEKLSKFLNNKTEFPKGLLEPVIFQEADRYNRVKDIVVNLVFDCPLRIDSQHLVKALTELIDNSLKFSSAGQKITVSDQLENNAYCLVIEDEGIGMSDEEIENIGPYIQFHRSVYEQQGVGLGLTLAAKIAYLYNGKLKLQPNPKQGTIQRLEIPIYI